MPGDAQCHRRLRVVREVLLVCGRWERQVEPEVGGCWRGGKLVPQACGLCAWVLGSEGCACRREEKEFGFRGSEGRLLLLQVCGVRVQVAQERAVSGKTQAGGLVTVPDSL